MNEITVGFNYRAGQVPGDLSGKYWTIDPKTYPDGSPLVGFVGDENFEYGVDTMILRPQTLEQFVTAMFWVDAYTERGGQISTLILPHVPGGRQDRINDSGDYLFTLKSVAKMINARNFDRVILLDPHSNVTPALIDRSKVVPLASLFKNFWNGYDGVIAPDAGASRRAFEVAQQLNLPVRQGEKHRDVATGKLSGFAVNGLGANKHYLVVDDICDGGGTFNGLASEIRWAGSTADLFVTHGIFSQGTETLLQNYKRIYSTDTTTFDKPNVGILDAMKEIKEWIF